MPDLLVLSNTLGGGVPISAALAVIDVVEEEHVFDRARARGEYLLERLGELHERHEQIGDIRGLGLLCGLALVVSREKREPADALGLALTDECQRRGRRSISFAAALLGKRAVFGWRRQLTVGEDEIDLAATIIDDALRTVVDRTATAAAVS